MRSWEREGGVVLKSFCLGCREGSNNPFFPEIVHLSRGFERGDRLIVPSFPKGFLWPVTRDRIYFKKNISFLGKI